MSVTDFGEGLPCLSCDGKGKVDDRGWPLRGLPYFDTKDCDRCRGLGHVFLVVGFEGAAADDVAVTFGAAALSGHHTLINPVLGTIDTLDALDGLIAEGAIARTPAFGVALARVKEPLCVLRHWRDDASLNAAIGPEVAGLPTWVTNSEPGGIDHRFVLFPSFEALQVAGTRAAARLRRMADSLRKNAIVLDPWDGIGREQWLARNSRC